MPYCICGSKVCKGVEMCEDCAKPNESVCRMCKKACQQSVCDVCRRSKMVEIGAPLLDYLREDNYDVAPETEIQCLYENAFVEWGMGKFSFWFAMSDIAESSDRTVEEVRAMVPNGGYDSSETVIRFANSDTYVFANSELRKVVCQHLKRVLVEFI